VTKVVFLDTGPLGQLSHPRPNQKVTQWLFDLLDKGIEVVLPEIADYEVRRELIRAKKTKGIQRLDQLKNDTFYAPITTAAMLKAADLWAAVRIQGKPTADRHALDGDAILAAQALTYDAANRSIVIATDNVVHLSRFVAAQAWETIT
jgi:predicted nucleic acid-binding protein